MNQGASSEVATIAGGCFWCIEAIFLEVDGIEHVIPGYTGGTTANPTYHEVCNNNTGHAEAVQVNFDPAKISYHEILDIFFSVHDPTTLNEQGADRGTQYRSVVFYHDEQQKAIVEKLVKNLNESHLWKKPIVTQTVPLNKFYLAEDYHREYFSRHPEQAYCRMVISSKLNRFRKQWTKRINRRLTK